MARHILSLLLLYVILDFANPLMPGAVRFEAGSIEVVQADRPGRPARTVLAPARLLSSPPAWTGIGKEDPGLARTLPAPPAPTFSLRVARNLTPRHVTAPPPPPASSEDR